MSETRVELIIVGGGLTGLTLAIACGAAGIEVARGRSRGPRRACWRRRTTAAPPRSPGARSRCSRRDRPLAAARAGRRADPRDPRRRWRLAALPALRPCARSAIVPLGYIVENRVLRRALLERVSRSCRVSRISAPLRRSSASSGARARWPSSPRAAAAAAQLVAAADGPPSPLRQAAGISTVTWYYPQIGIVCTVRHARAASRRRGRAFPARRAFRHPADDRRPLVDRLDRARAISRRRCWRSTRRALLAELARRFGDFLGALTLEGRAGPTRSRSCTRSRLGPRRAWRSSARPRMSSIRSPGQGFNLGMRDVAALAELVVDARRLGLDIGHASMLCRATSAAAARCAAAGGRHRRAQPAVLQRRAACAGARSRPCRGRPPAAAEALFMRHAMGMVGDVPRLARGEPL